MLTAAGTSRGSIRSRAALTRIAGSSLAETAGSPVAAASRAAAGTGDAAAATHAAVATASSGMDEDFRKLAERSGMAPLTVRGR